MQNQPEHRNGWRATVAVDDHTVSIEACHYTRKRMPRGHEMVRNIARGQPQSMVEETDYAWAVICEQQRICTLKQYPSGAFYTGQHIFKSHEIREATIEAVRIMAPRFFITTEEENTSSMKI